MKRLFHLFSVVGRISLVLFLGMGLPEQGFADPWDELLKKYYALFKDLHMHPELSGQEKETSEKFATALGSLNFEGSSFSVQQNVGGYGVLGVFENGTGPTLLIRTDMDALPIQEATNLAYASLNEGVMHACGHDTHMAIALGTAEWLLRNQSQWKGRLIILGQPAEETQIGAQAVIQSNEFKNLGKIHYALAIHNHPGIDSNQVAISPGPVMARLDTMEITLHGKGGHSSNLGSTINPIFIGSSLALQLDAINKTLDPKQAVLGVGALNSGKAANAIPAFAHLKLTARAFDENICENLVRQIENAAIKNSENFLAEAPNVRVVQSTPTLINDAKLVETIRPSLISAFGEKNVIPAPRVMAAEDFTLFGQKLGIPANMIFVGSRVPGKVNNPFVHSEFYVADHEPLIENGIKTFYQSALTLLNP